MEEIKEDIKVPKIAEKKVEKIAEKKVEKKAEKREKNFYKKQQEEKQKRILEKRKQQEEDENKIRDEKLSNMKQSVVIGQIENINSKDEKKEVKVLTLDNVQKKNIRKISSTKQTGNRLN